MLSDSQCHIKQMPQPDTLVTLSSMDVFTYTFNFCRAYEEQFQSSGLEIILPSLD